MDVDKTTCRPRISFEFYGEVIQMLAGDVCVCSKWFPQFSVIAVWTIQTVMHLAAT